MTEAPRHTTGPLPPYTYVPGQQPHPISDPRGHMYGQHPPEPPPLDPESWGESESYLYAIDLFNNGYYWEAHEAWESLWLAAGRTGTMADFLKGLIKIAAAHVKRLEGNPVGVERHTARAIELLALAAASESDYCGLDLEQLLTECRDGHSVTKLLLRSQ